MKKMNLKDLFSPKLRSRTLSYLGVVIVWIVIEVLLKTGSLTRMLTALLVPVCCYVVASIGLNLNVGFSGELNLGQAGFMSVGAFSGIVLSGILQIHGVPSMVRLILAIVFATLMGAVFGWLIGKPVLRLQGDYLAIVTLAFGEIIKSLIINLYCGYDSAGLHFSFVNNNIKLQPGGKMLINGAMGATSIQKISVFTVGILMVLAALAVSYNLIYSRSGRAIMAARDNRIAAESTGIDISKTKMLSFVISASMAGAAGALFGLNFSAVMPANFDFNTSIMILVYVVLGGLGSMNGTLIATTILVLLPELLRPIKDYRMLLYAIILIAMMLIRNNEKIRVWQEKMKEKMHRGKEAKVNE